MSRSVPDRWRWLNTLSDEQLASTLISGEQEARTVLFDRYHKLVFSVAMRIVNDAGEAEEVVQTVFLDFFRGLAIYDPEKGILKVWLLQYAYHRVEPKTAFGCQSFLSPGGPGELGCRAKSYVESRCRNRVGSYYGPTDEQSEPASAPDSGVDLFRWANAACP